MDPSHLNVTDRSFVLIKALRSGGVESSSDPSFDEVYN